MQRYIAARLIQAVVTLLLLSLAVFLSVRMTGNAADFLIGPEAEVSAEEYEQLKANLGLDKPLPVQYALFLTKIVRLDFGESIIMGRSAREVLLERFPATLELAGAALALTVVVGLPLGIVSAVKRDTVLDHSASCLRYWALPPRASGSLSCWSWHSGPIWGGSPHLAEKEVPAISFCLHLS